MSCRIVVRIDSWEVGSQYPNGHFVRSLGVAGDVETEVQALLLENSISVLPFTEAQVSGHWGALWRGWRRLNLRDFNKDFRVITVLLG